MIDSHCHLQLCREPINDILQRAHDAGVTDIVQVATDVATAEYSIELAKKNSSVHLHPTAGLYPSRAAEAWQQEIPKLRTIFESEKVVALGEVGIDLFHDTSYLAAQQEMLRSQLQLAQEFDQPCIFHIRHSYDEVVAVLDEFKTGKALKGVWHCFEGTLEQAEHFVNRGWYISFSGLVTYKKNDALREAALALPLDRILVETDSPYLSPEPLRREKNEPWKVSKTLAFLAELRPESVEEVHARTVENTRRLFSLPMP